MKKPLIAVCLALSIIAGELGLNTQIALAGGKYSKPVSYPNGATLTAQAYAPSWAGASAVSFYALTRQLPQGVTLLRTISTILAVAMLAVCCLVGWSIGSAIGLSRRYLIGLLKALGQTSIRIALTLLSELALFGLLLGSAAFLVSVVILFFIVQLYAGSSIIGVTIPSNMVWPSGLWIITELLGPLVAICVGSLPRIISTSMLQPDQALRDL